MHRAQAETTDSVVFNGITFRRYPNSRNKSDSMYYRASGGLRKQGIAYLHHEVWRAHYGEIPEGCHVHHKDGDTTNNDISNLAAVPASKHLSRHTLERISKNPKWIANALDKARDKAKIWHKSREGREWHRQHGLETAAKRKNIPKVTKTCEQCGGEYETMPDRAGISRYCSRACHAKHRRDSGIDNETRRCAICGNEFVVNRYSKIKTCSKECSTRSMLNNRRKS